MSNSFLADRILEDLRAGLSSREIAERRNCRRETVLKIRREVLGIVGVEHKPFVDEAVAALQEIAKRHGVPARRVARSAFARLYRTRDHV